MQANDLVEITGHPEALSAEELLDWLQGTAPLPGDDRVNFVFLASALPGWEVHKYVEEQKRAQANWLKLRRLQKETQGRIEEVGAQIEGGHGDD
ncbi:hypothetical protein FIV07_00065 [Mycobacterium sp. THAF192]|nr:hypothetical protein FIV07_00065 [Mycobacterium sp. THAF192]